jgi:hypothetical protein
LVCCTKKNLAALAYGTDAFRTYVRFDHKKCNLILTEQDSAAETNFDRANIVVGKLRNRCYDFFNIFAKKWQKMAF